MTKSTTSDGSEMITPVQIMNSDGLLDGENASIYESVTITDSAISLTSATYLTSTKAEMTLETAQIRVRKDGSDPTSSEGHIVDIGDVIVINSAADLATFKAIRTGSTSGVLKITYSK